MARVRVRVRIMARVRVRVTVSVRVRVGVGPVQSMTHGEKVAERCVIPAATSQPSLSWWLGA